MEITLQPPQPLLENENNEERCLSEQELDNSDDVKNELRSNLTKKWFSEGSIFGSVVNLCSATLGAGSLSLPYAISLSGILGGIGLLILGSLSTYFSIHLLIEASHATQCRGYEAMGMRCFGSLMSYLIETCILVFCFGCAVAYIIAVGDILEQTVLLILPMHNLITRQSLMVLFWATIMFPLSLLQRMNSLRYISFIGTTSIFILIFAVVFHSIQYLKQDHQSNEIDSFHIKLWPDSLQDLLRAFPIMMFAFGCQINVFAIYSELSTPSPSQMSTVTFYTVLLCFVGYSLIGIFGYLNFRENTQEDVLSNYCLIDNPDVMMSIAFSFIILALTFSYPMNVLPSRATLHIISKRISMSILPTKDEHIMINNSDNKCNKDFIIPSSLYEPIMEMEAPTEEETDTEDTFLEEDQTQISLFTDSSNQEDSHPHVEDETKLSTIRNFMLTSFISGSSLLIAIYVPDISLIFGLMGSSASSVICYITPAMFYFYTLKFMNEEINIDHAWKDKLKCFCVGIFLLIGIVTGVLGTIFTLIGSNGEEKEETNSFCNNP